MAYAPRTEKTHALLNSLRLAIRRRYRLTTTLGYGPRFLHSTGQLHKGGANKGLFIQITCETDEDIEIPGKAYTFGVLAAAQAQGDYQALNEGGRRLIRLHVKENVDKALQGIVEALNT